MTLYPKKKLTIKKEKKNITKILNYFYVLMNFQQNK